MPSLKEFGWFIVKTWFALQALKLVTRFLPASIANLVNDPFGSVTK